MGACSLITLFDCDYKLCSRCKEGKPTSDFGNVCTPKNRFGIRRKIPDSVCRKCNTEVRSAWRRKHPDREAKTQRKAKLKVYEGMTLEEYGEMLERQNGVCAICKKTCSTKYKSGKVRDLSVDHDHDTGKVRGLLCNACNLGIGKFNDDAELLKAAAEYLCKRNPA